MEGVFFGLTSCAEIRAQLGSGDSEFDDEYIGSLGLDSELQLDLLDWFPNYQALVDDDSGDTEIIKQQLAIKAYAKSYCALKSVPTLRMRFVQKKADGDNQAHRFQNKDTINDLQADLQVKAAEYKHLVLSLTTAFSPTEAETTYVTLGAAISTPDNDVITTGR